MSYRPIPVIDLFAGPGGLGEGFSAATTCEGNRVFDIQVSIEKDSVAHRTLSLRALFRAFPRGDAPDCYYDYLRRNISRQDLLNNPAIATEVARSNAEAHCATLGETPAEEIDKWISNAIGDTDPWVLIGGPPCQAYSIAGRSRMRGADPTAFEKDKRHFLYKEYLRIIQKFQPAVFIMENVKGLLSSTHDGSPIFERILQDLSSPADGLEYEIRSFVSDKNAGELEPRDFIIESEQYGVPQTRHRVILLGVRKDYAHRNHRPLVVAHNQVNVKDALHGLPKVRSRLSREPDSFASWLDALTQAPKALKGWRSSSRFEIESRMSSALAKARKIQHVGGEFLPVSNGVITPVSGDLGSWYVDPRLGGICQHETRQHMRSDLHRYMFAACYSESFGVSPKIQRFPEKLLPDHKNVDAEEIPFKDRFRVQVWHSPSTTIVSHIAKDGHYYIHPDPAQGRSLTVREAARLQTFPDNYYFEGNRTQQYAQIGNAVPPYLARQLGCIVADLLDNAYRGKARRT